MSPDDDQIRRALTADTPRAATAHTALRQMGPSMRRARMRRRVAVSATAAALLVGGGAGVFALTADREHTTLRIVTSDQTGEPLPTVTDVAAPSTTVPTSVAALEEPMPEPTAAAAPTPTPSDDDDGSAPTDSDETIAPIGETPSPVVEVPEMPDPAEPPAPVSPPPAWFETITSACGDVVVSIDAGTVRIVTITARPGFDQSVSDDGPNSIEMTFIGQDDVKCELHAELTSGGLDVEVQGPETER